MKLTRFKKTFKPWGHMQTGGETFYNFLREQKGVPTSSLQLRIAVYLVSNFFIDY